MACSVLKRKDNSIQKDSEMASGRSLIKRRKFESSTNGETENPEVRSTLKGHRPLLCVRRLLTRLSACSCCKDFKGKLKF